MRWTGTPGCSPAATVAAGATGARAVAGAQLQPGAVDRARIARRFADADLRVDNNAVVRIRETDVQQRLNWIERRRNVRVAPSRQRVPSQVNQCCWLMTLTTGATLNELARVAVLPGPRRWMRWCWHACSRCGGASGP